MLSPLLLLLSLSLSSPFLLPSSTLPHPVSHLQILGDRVEAVVNDKKFGLLDKSNTDRAELGPLIKIPNEQKMRVGIIGAGLAGMVTAMDLSEVGHDVTIFESRPFVGGKVSSWIDKDGNHIEMGLHVFFGCYYNLFGILRRLKTMDKSLRLKVHEHT